MNPTLAIALALFILLILLALILSMFISLGRQGDERRRLIVEKASFGTLSITAIYLLFEIFERMVLVFTGRELSPGGINPFTLLTVVSVIYMGNLIWYKRKYGD